MKIAKAFSVLALFASVGMFSHTAQADPIVWTLQGVTFDDGGTATGSFIYDAATNTYSSWDIATTRGFAVILPFTYGSSADLFEPSASQVGFHFELVPLGFRRNLNLTFLSPLTDAGGTIGILSQSYEYDVESHSGLPVIRHITAGSVSTGPAAVPEPATFVLLANGILVGGLIKLVQIRRTP